MKNEPQSERSVSDKGEKRTFFYPSLWLKIVIIIQFLFLGMRFYPALSTNGDNAKYYILGNALSEFKGYTQIHLPLEPVETQYPILFPLLLGAIGFISDTPFLSKIFISGIVVLVTMLFYYFGKDYFGYLLIPLLFLTATSSAIAGYGSIIMSEAPYLFFTLLSLYFYDISIKNQHNKRLFLLAILLSILPFHCRSIGLAFSGAFVIVNLIQKRYKYVFAHSILLIGTAVVFRYLTSMNTPYIIQLFMKNSYNPELGYVSLMEMSKRILDNIIKYSTYIIGDAYWPFLSSYPASIRSTVSLIFLLIAFIGWIRIYFSPLKLLSVYILFYFGILSVWQIQWSSLRFLISIIPFLILFLFSGIDTMLTFTDSHEGTFMNKLRNRFTSPFKKKVTLKRHITVLCIAIILIGANTFDQFLQVKKNKSLSADWVNYFSCADWIRLNTPKDAVIMSRKAELFYLRSKRKGIAYPFTHDIDKIISVMKEKHVSYVVFDNFFWTNTTKRYLFPVIRYFPEKFEIVYALKNPNTFIFEFLDK